MVSAVVESLSHVWLFETPPTAARQAPLSSTVSWSLLTFMSIELVMLFNHLIPYHPCFGLQSFPGMGCLPTSWLFASCGQSIGASASVSVLPMNIQGWFPLGLTDLICLQSKGLSRVFSSPSFLCLQLEMIFKIMTWAISESYSIFLGVHIINHLLAFLFIFYYGRITVKKLGR